MGSFPPERFGLHDLSGNVTEWVNDPPRDAEPATMATGRYDVSLRGPAFNDGTSAALSFAYVRPSLPLKRIVNVGFRMVLEWQ